MPETIDEIDPETSYQLILTVLDEAGIETRPVFWPMHMMPPYKSTSGKCPVAGHIGLTGLSLPSGSHVTEEDVCRIARIVAQETG